MTDLHSDSRVRIQGGSSALEKDATLVEEVLSTLRLLLGRTLSAAPQAATCEGQGSYADGEICSWLTVPMALQTNSRQ